MKEFCLVQVYLYNITRYFFLTDGAQVVEIQLFRQNLTCHVIGIFLNIHICLEELFCRVSHITFMFVGC